MQLDSKLIAEPAAEQFNIHCWYPNAKPVSRVNSKRGGGISRNLAVEAILRT